MQDRGDAQRLWILLVIFLAAATAVAGTVIGTIWGLASPPIVTARDAKAPRRQKDKKQQPVRPKRTASRQELDKRAQRLTIMASVVESTCTGPEVAAVRASLAQQGLSFSDTNCRRLAARCSKSAMDVHDALKAACPAGNQRCHDEAGEQLASTFEACFVRGSAEMIE